MIMKQILKLICYVCGAGALVCVLAAEETRLLGLVAAAALIWATDRALAKLDPSYPDADRA